MPEGRTFSWIDAAGVVTEFTGQRDGFWVLDGVTGLGMPTYTMDKQDRVVKGGYSYKSARAASRVIFLPIEINAPTRRQYLTRKQDVAWAFDPTRGPGRLLINDNGFIASISAIYINGMEGDEGIAMLKREGRSFYGKTGITLDCPDVFFDYGVETVIGAYRGEPVAPPQPFFPIFPIKLTSSQITGGGSIVNNVGTADSWPVWKITGPSTRIILTKYSDDGTSETIDLLYTQSANETITIDTSVPEIYSSDDTNLYEFLEQDEFWAISRGQNNIEVRISGATETTTIRGTYRPRLIGLS